MEQVAELTREVYAYIPNSDTYVGGLQLIYRSGHEVVTSAWRIAGEWTDLEDSETVRFRRDSMAYYVQTWAEPTLLALHDAGEDVCACFVEIANRPADLEVVARQLGYTREHLELLLKARARREVDTSQLTAWTAAFDKGGVRPLPSEALARIVELHREARVQGPPLQRIHLELSVAPVPDVNWDALLEEDQQTKEGWRRLTTFIAALIALTDDAVVVSVRTEQFDDDVYVQLCREDDGALHLEAVSDTYLEPPLSPDAIDALHALGWQDPPGDGLDNYVLFLEAGQTAPGLVAALLAETLRRAYSTKPSDLHKFEPNAEVRALLRGDFGPDCAVRPSMGLGRQARLFMGLRFPHDVGPDG